MFYNLTKLIFVGGMAKNTGDIKFRKVNVDQYKDATFQDDQVDDSTLNLNVDDINKLISRYF